MKAPYKGAITGGTNVPEGLPTAPLLRATAKAVLLLAVLYWLTRKRVNMLVYADLVIRYILLQLLLDIFLYFLGVLSYSTIIHYILDVFDNPTLAYEIVDEIGNFI